MAKTKTPKRSKPSPSSRRVCPECFTPRPDFNSRMKYPPPCPQCKSTTPPVQPPKPTRPTKPPPGELPPGGALVPEIVDQTHVVNLKADFTPNELDFLSLVLSSEETIENAMNKAGYGHLEKWNKYYTANRILQKHVEQAGDIKKLMRSCGLGEIHVILKIKQLMDDPSKTIQARGVELAAKILEMTKESIDLNTGIQIVFKTADGKVVRPTPAGQVQPAKPGPKALPAPGPKVRMIK